MIESSLMTFKNLLIIHCIACIGLNSNWCAVHYVTTDNEGKWWSIACKQKHGRTSQRETTQFYPQEFNLKYVTEKLKPPKS